MKKVLIQNLAMIVTQHCNLNCKHCLRGDRCDEKMSKEVIEKTLRQVAVIGNLCLCGGEPTLALDVIYQIFHYIVEHDILVYQVSVTINGTNYSPEFLTLLDYISDYIPDRNVVFAISSDQYHMQELERFNLLATYKANIIQYSASPYFIGTRELDPKLKLFREGNAENLDSAKTIDLRPLDIIITYVNNDIKRLCCIGPMMAVNTAGIITEENASNYNQYTKYNYGNVFINTFEKVALARGRIISDKCFDRKTNKIMRKYLTYNK